MEWIEHPSDDDVLKLALVAAMAFDNDQGNYVAYGGIRYSENPSVSEAVFRAWMRRTLAGGGVLVTDADRKCMRIMFPPGVPNRAHDRSLDSSKDPDWKTLEHAVDPSFVWSNFSALQEPIQKILLERYGPDPSEVIWRSACTVVDPSAQGKGLGKAMNAFIMEKVKLSGKQWGHACMEHTLPFYQRCGMKVVAPIPVKIHVDSSWSGTKDSEGHPKVWWVETPLE